MAVRTKRVYEPPSRGDGQRVLVDRLWPRGVSKDEAKVTLWLKEIAPSNELRKWYHEHPQQWPAFRARYLDELGKGEAAEAFQQLLDLSGQKRNLTLLYSSRLEKNNATVLEELLNGEPKPPRSSGPAHEAAGAGQKRARARAR